MNGHTAVKVGLGRTHLHGNTEALEHLTDSEAENVQTDNLLLRTGADDFHLGGVLGLLLLRHHAVVHGRELGVVDLDLIVTVALASLRLGQTNGTDFGVGEDDGGDVVIVELGGLELGRAKEAAAQMTTSGNGNCDVG